MPAPGLSGCAVPGQACPELEGDFVGKSGHLGRVCAQTMQAAKAHRAKPGLPGLPRPDRCP